MRLASIYWVGSRNNIKFKSEQLVRFDIKQDKY